MNMIRSPSRCLLPAAAIIACLLPVGLAAQTPALPDALRQCLAVVDDPARLACYDSLARTRTAAPARQDAALPDRVESFGQPAAQVVSSDDSTETLIDIVSEARRLEPTRWLLTLQSGQVWRQTVGKSYLIRPGDQVRISSSSWGSDFRLSVDGRRGYIQVSRVQQ